MAAAERGASDTAVRQSCSARRALDRVDANTAVCSRPACTASCGNRTRLPKVCRPTFLLACSIGNAERLTSTLPRRRSRSWQSPMTSRQYFLPERPSQLIPEKTRVGRRKLPSTRLPARRSLPAGTDCSLSQVRLSATPSRHSRAMIVERVAADHPLPFVRSGEPSRPLASRYQRYAQCRQSAAGSELVAHAAMAPFSLQPPASMPAPVASYLLHRRSHARGHRCPLEIQRPNPPAGNRQIDRPWESRHHPRPAIPDGAIPRSQTARTIRPEEDPLFLCSA